MTGPATVLYWSPFAAAASCAACWAWKACSRSWTFSSARRSTWAWRSLLSLRRFSISAIDCQKPLTDDPTAPRTRSAGTRNSVAKMDTPRTAVVSRSSRRARLTVSRKARGRTKAFPPPCARRALPNVAIKDI